jgi:hypothetical protein
LSSAWIAGCTTGGRSTLGASPADTPYFIDFKAPVTVERPYLDRYACSSNYGGTLMCTCSSMHLGRCDCSCR